ncbi:MAG: hypothetical protein ACO3JL_11140 [Myxococcota bacterium]
MRRFPARYLLRVFALLLVAAGCGDVVDSAADCRGLCQLEDDCGLRSLADCMSQSCDAEGMRRMKSAADECMQVAETCAEVALCTCASSCSAVDVCAGAADPSCEPSCEVLVEQDPIVTFQENRCRIEATCEELPLCGAM